MIKILLVLVLICCETSKVLSQDTKDISDSVSESRRLHFLAGAGLLKGVFGGSGWQIPFTNDGGMIMEMSIGVIPVRWSFAGSGSAGWQSISRQSDVGSLVMATFSFERWDNGPEEWSRNTISLNPGVLLRFGSSLISFKIGPGLSWLLQIRVTEQQAETIHRSEFTFNAEASISF